MRTLLLALHFRKNIKELKKHMNKDLEESLFNSHPILYRERHLPETLSLMSWGFTCDDGWFELLKKLSGQLEEYNRNNPDNPVIARQVKSKFGGLRFYVHGGNEYTQELIDSAQAESYRIPES